MTANPRKVWLMNSRKTVYVLVAIVWKRLNLRPGLYTILQILSVACFEKAHMLQLLTGNAYKFDDAESCNQLKPFN